MARRANGKSKGMRSEMRQMMGWRHFFFHRLCAHADESDGKIDWLHFNWYRLSWAISVLLSARSHSLIQDQNSRKVLGIHPIKITSFTDNTSTRRKKRRQLSQTHQHNSINKFDSVFIPLSRCPPLFARLVFHFPFFFLPLLFSPLCIKDLDTRIIIGSFSHELAPKIFCEVRIVYISAYMYMFPLIVPILGPRTVFSLRLVVLWTGTSRIHCDNIYLGSVL